MVPTPSGLPELARVETLVSEALGLAVRVERCDRLAPPWCVARCELAPRRPPVPAAVVVKWLRDGPSRSDPQQMGTERVALQFLTEVAPGLGPALIAGDRDARLLVLEDLQPRGPLYDLLDGPETEAGRRGVAAFARALGRLAAATHGHHEAYYTRRRAVGPVDPRRDRLGPLRDRWVKTLAAADALGISPGHRVEAEMGAVLDGLEAPDAFLAFSNGDAGDNNFLVHGDDGRFIDFEFAGYRHALLDGACLHVPGPRWITMPDPVRSGYEELYRTALAAGIPEAEDDRLFGAGMAAAAVAVAMERAAERIAKVGRRGPGDPSRPQMISTLEAAARAAAHHRSLPHLAGWLRALAGELRRRWPDADSTLRRLAAEPAAWVRRAAPADHEGEGPGPAGAAE